MSIRFLTAGESHGKGTIVILEGFPAGLLVSVDDINFEMARRQKGYGRGGRMLIETDQVEILSGIRKGVTLGSPITLFVKNKDYENWEKIMTPDVVAGNFGNPLQRPRPGHADLSGGIKYNHRDLRNILERASARETTVRVAAGAVAKKLLSNFNISVQSYVCQLGSALSKKGPVRYDKLNELADKSPVRMLEKKAEKKAISLIDLAKKKGDTLGGIFEVIVTGVPVGLGSHVQWDRKLDGKLAQSLMSMQAIKGVEIGAGFSNAVQPGSRVHDEIAYQNKKGFYHLTNRAGGIEGGMSNGEPIVIRVAKKPIATLKKPLRSVDIETKKEIRAAYERSDVCALPAASVIGETICAWVIADAFLEKMGGDFMQEIQQRYQLYLKHVRNY
ncbi:MAG TPA: chorismate synthase [bacterium]|jgi:chorismate synthase|nr:chorismate synthase [bacterium]